MLTGAFGKRLLIWTIDPVKRTITLYRADGHVLEVSGDGERDGYDVLPGFKLRLAELFQVLDKTP